ncbi:MAG: hypothetical protein ACM3KL_07135, partial [Alphaproteobacteria bacterium]
MAKLTLTSCILPLLLLFTPFEARSGNPRKADSPSNGSVTMDIDRGSGSQADDLAEANPLSHSGYRVPGVNGVPR